MRFVQVWVALSLVGCAPPVVDHCDIARSQTRVFTLDSIRLPQQRADYAYDLNGDKKPDNQLGNIVGALTAQNINPQDMLDMAFAAGTELVDLRVLTADPGSIAKANAIVTMTDRRAGGPDGVFCGSLGSGAFDADEPKDATEPVETRLRISFFNDAAVLVIGAFLKFSPKGDGISGQFNAAITDSEMVSVVIPGIADLLTKKVQGDPMASLSKLIVAVFDTGGDPSVDQCGATCQNPDGTCSHKGDHVIDLCEVRTNPIVKNVLAPDVQMLSDDGKRFAPSPANGHKDSVSMGFSFTAK